MRRSIPTPSPSMVVALIALAVAGAGGATAATLITGAQIKNGSITGADVKDNSLTAKDIKGQLQGPQGATGAQGPAGTAGAKGDAGVPGPAGAAGAKGDAGVPGPSDAFSRFRDGPIQTSTPLTSIGQLNIPQAGSYVIFGKGFFGNNSAVTANMDCRLVAEADFDQQRFVLGNTTSAAAVIPASFNVVHTFAAPGIVDLNCDDQGGDVTASFIKITAIRVGTLSNLSQP